MKKYSNYYKTCMVVAIASGVCACIIPSATGSAILFVVAFLSWYAGVMAPDVEKFKMTPSDKDVIPARNSYKEYTHEEKELAKRIKLVHELCDDPYDTLEVLEQLKVQMIRKSKYELAGMLDKEIRNTINDGKPATV